MLTKFEKKARIDENSSSPPLKKVSDAAFAASAVPCAMLKHFSNLPRKYGETEFLNNSSKSSALLLLRGQSQGAATHHGYFGAVVK